MPRRWLFTVIVKEVKVLSPLLMSVYPLIELKVGGVVIQEGKANGQHRRKVPFILTMGNVSLVNKKRDGLYDRNKESMENGTIAIVK